ncbi:MAG: hypothetical protein QM279_07900 [Atribacterota bacterium]|uniref:hypothetical protein n=1 Tax=Atribacter sp. TaxID=2847780 RepID=UPI00345E4824|nr:hypothetical protein [Atribacterota bacterium]
MITDDLENKDKAEKIHQLLLEIDEQQLQAKYRFKHRTLPFLIIIAILLFSALYLIYPCLYGFIETIIEFIEEQPPFIHDQKTPNIMVYEIDQRGKLMNQIVRNTKYLQLDHLS